MWWNVILPDLTDGSLLSVIALTSVGAAVASMLLAILALLRQRAQALRLSDALVLRDRLVKNLIVASTPDEDAEAVRQVVNEAFAKGNDFWIAQFVEPAYGSAEAVRMRGNLAKNMS